MPYQVQVAASRPGLRNLFDGLTPDIQAYFNEFRELIASNFSLEIVLAYVFFRLEQGQHMALFCGARKLHRLDGELTWKAIDSQHMIRDAFHKYFETIYGAALPKDVRDIVQPAEAIRDRLMHGKGTEPAQLREAISRVLQYAEQINVFLDQRRVGFHPFCGDLRGFVGRLESMDKATSRWVLKGMGFQIA
jgi:hypothetical protein